jgi:cell division protein FtsA
MAREYKDVVVGLDIGTAKIMAVVAEVLPTGELKLAGLGVAPSNGLKRGVVVNIEATVQSIQQALKEAEFMADCKIQRVYTGITGSHIRGLNSSGMVAVKDKEVTPADVARVVETAKAVNISSDQRLLLVEPQEFVIDGQDVKEPIGMSGIRLEAKVHIVPARRARPKTSSSACAAAASRSSSCCSIRWHRARPCSPTTNASSAWPWWTSARAPPTWPFSRAGRSATRR